MIKCYKDAKLLCGHAIALKDLFLVRECIHENFVNNSLSTDCACSLHPCSKHNITRSLNCSHGPYFPVGTVVSPNLYNDPKSMSAVCEEAATNGFPCTEMDYATATGNDEPNNSPIFHFGPWNGQHGMKLKRLFVIVGSSTAVAFLVILLLCILRKKRRCCFRKATINNSTQVRIINESNGMPVEGSFQAGVAVEGGHNVISAPPRFAVESHEVPSGSSHSYVLLQETPIPVSGVRFALN